jgi:chemotaxis protein MotB
MHRSIILSIVLTAVAGASSYYAFDLWQQQKHTVAKLASSTSTVASLKVERAKATEQMQLLEKENNVQAADIAQADATRLDLAAELAATTSRLAELEDQRQALDATLAEFRGVAKQFQRMIDSGKLEVNFRRGRMIVELPATVLFASGSAELSDEGRKSIEDVAKILRAVPGKRFIVGGHTDDVPVGKNQAGFTSNWALSAARAVTVTETLVKEGIRPARLVAAGFGEHDPIAKNNNAKGRQKNRRIEIVLEPVLKDAPDAAQRSAAKEAGGTKTAGH